MIEKTGTSKNSMELIVTFLKHDSIFAIFLVLGKLFKTRLSYILYRLCDLVILSIFIEPKTFNDSSQQQTI